jgi:hypothetical protein
LRGHQGVDFAVDHVARDVDQLTVLVKVPVLSVPILDERGDVAIGRFATAPKLEPLEDLVRRLGVLNHWISSGEDFPYSGFPVIGMMADVAKPHHRASLPERLIEQTTP